MATSFFYIYVMATSFFFIYVMSTSFFYIYIDIYICIDICIEIYIDIYFDIFIDMYITYTNWRSVQSFYWTLFFMCPWLVRIASRCKWWSWFQGIGRILTEKSFTSTASNSEMQKA